MPPTDIRDLISAAYLADEDSLAGSLISAAQMTPIEAASTHKLARELVLGMRKVVTSRNGVDALLQEYALSCEEGVMLMCLAEALLRVPDAETAEKLIRDKIAGQKWDRHLGQSRALFVNASTWALMLSGEIVDVPDTAEWDFEGIWRRLAARIGEPVIRAAITHAIRLLGRHFILGRTIEEALHKAVPLIERGYQFSFDMLGEAAYTSADARRYYGNYYRALDAIATALPDTSAAVFRRPGISIKLSALHPRFEYFQRGRVMSELIGPLLALCTRARAANLGVTIDAEEADRLDLTLDMFESLCEEPSLKGFEGLGIAVQAYQKRALPVIAWLGNLAKRQGRRIPIRLVKGAYWDSEIKRAQELGLSDYPVFTRKATTDVSYIACVKALLADRISFFPQFATHNAQTLAAIQTLASNCDDYEYQRLYGMGDALYEVYNEMIGPKPNQPGTRIYAPVGGHEELLSYLMRRLLENGANTSFVNRLTNDKSPIEDVIADPVERLVSTSPKRNPRISKPEALFPGRRNSSGLLLSDPAQSARLINAMEAALKTVRVASPIVGGAQMDRPTRAIRDPSDRRRIVGEVSEANEDDVYSALAIANDAQPHWDRQGGTKRAEILERAADLFEDHHAELMALLVREAGRTVQDALGEVREAVDFLRYYAVEARARFATPVLLPGIAGEKNLLSLHGRGVFACIAPWNFPLSIFAGQVSAALAAGNSVLAKPAEQTPLIASAATRLFFEAGVPIEILHLLPGDGARLGSIMLSDPRLAGVAFTGSTETAVSVNRALAGRSGTLATLIAETGGLNAMIVDSTALPEQVAHDVVISAFNSAGQRCSALRVLFLQEDTAERIQTLVLGAMDELKIGDPFDLATDIGPIIDEEARTRLQDHVQRISREGIMLRALKLPPETNNGVFFAPHAFEIDGLQHLKGEVFGPILHIIRFAEGRLASVCEAINGTNFGLTLGVHSRIDATAEFIHDYVRAGNVYVNRSQIGAVVESQPFGGERLSGTGPKAGGPNYLPRFATERSYSVNTAAVGGNITLLTLDDSASS